MIASLNFGSRPAIAALKGSIFKGRMELVRAGDHDAAMALGKFVGKLEMRIDSARASGERPEIDRDMVNSILLEVLDSSITEPLGQKVSTIVNTAFKAVCALEQAHRNGGRDGGFVR